MMNMTKNEKNAENGRYRDFGRYNFDADAYRGQHASGTEREYVEKAIECGIKVWGFADHVPCPFKEPERKSTIRMEMYEAYEYADTIRELAKEYKSDIDILLGFEAEYIPEFFDEQQAMCKEINLDYLIMGQHFIHGAPGTPYTGTPTTDKSMMTEYVDSVIAGAKTGKFMYIAHPDLVHYIGDQEFYKSEARRLCVSMKEMNIPLEINNLGMAGGRHYPNEIFWKIASEVGCEAMIGLDAHCLRDICYAEAYEKCKEMALRLKLNLITDDTLALKVFERWRLKYQ